MSDEPTAEVRELAAKLFAAARAEQPGPALGRRSRCSSRHTLDRPRPRRLRQTAPHGARLPSYRRARVSCSGSPPRPWLASGVGLWLVSEPDARPLSISPDRPPSRLPRHLASPAQSWLLRCLRRRPPRRPRETKPNERRSRRRRGWIDGREDGRAVPPRRRHHVCARRRAPRS